ncbi:MAG: hypothetical protein MZV70_20265 [Desulfobacterales bacterium]|nr:hypothetical protein [Desulfobacterales bacterium]
MPGAYVPALLPRDLHPRRGPSTRLSRPRMSPRGSPGPLSATFPRTATCSTVLTPDTAFGRRLSGRGRPRAARTAAASAAPGFVYRPPRFRPVGGPRADHRARAFAHTDQIGLVGAAVSDLPGIGGPLPPSLPGAHTTISFSSLRADALGRRSWWTP